MRSAGRLLVQIAGAGTASAATAAGALFSVISFQQRSCASGRQIAEQTPSRSGGGADGRKPAGASADTQSSRRSTADRSALGGGRAPSSARLGVLKAFTSWPGRSRDTCRSGSRAVGARIQPAARIRRWRTPRTGRVIEVVELIGVRRAITLRIARGSPAGRRRGRTRRSHRRRACEEVDADRGTSGAA